MKKIILLTVLFSAPVLGMNDGVDVGLACKVLKLNREACDSLCPACGDIMDEIRDCTKCKKKKVSGYCCAPCFIDIVYKCNNCGISTKNRNAFYNKKQRVMGRVLARYLSLFDDTTGVAGAATSAMQEAAGGAAAAMQGDVVPDDDDDVSSGGGAAAGIAEDAPTSGGASDLGAAIAGVAAYPSIQRDPVSRGDFGFTKW